ncbi:MAG: cytidine deaminase [Candidatus Promineifilaceae bacterium]
MMISLKEEEALLAAARECRHLAYAPYSHYLVGAALLAADGQIYTGVNVENASYGLAICAERSAIVKMVANGAREIKAMAVCTSNGGSPCGACRQVMNEFAAADFPVYLCAETGSARHTTLYTLLPDRFGPEHLP